MDSNRNPKLPEVPLEEANIFTNMFSLLRMARNDTPQVPNVVLPNIFQNLDTSSYGRPAEKNLKACKTNTACPHVDRKHYAKNMCSNCYHKHGRQKAVWLCPHEDRTLYAKGKCQQCYLQEYHASKNNERNRSRERHEI